MADQTRLDHQRVRRMLLGLVLGLALATLSTSVVGPALPSIVGELGGQDKLAWVAGATLLTMTVSVPLWGKLSDRVGRKLLFQLSLLLFVVPSAVAGLAQDIGTLVASRAVQGIGAGGLTTLAQVILADLVPPRQRGRYTGYFGSVLALSTVAGPVIGGALTETPWLGWRWCFFLSVPLGIVASLAVRRHLHLDPHPSATTRLDWFGAVCITGAAGAAMVLLSLGGTVFEWSSPWSYGLGGLAVLLLVLAFPAERRAEDPIMPGRLFLARLVVLPLAASAIIGVSTFGAVIYLPQYLQIVRGLSPTVSGLMMLAMTMGLVTCSVIAGRSATRTGRWKRFPVLGLVLVCVGLALLATLEPDSPVGWIVARIVLIGCGLGLSTQLLMLAAQNAATPSDLAVTTSAVTFFRTLGGALGVAVFGAVLAGRLSSEITSRAATAGVAVPTPAHGGQLGTPNWIRELPSTQRTVVTEAFTQALHTVFVVAAVIAVLGLIAVLLLKESPLRTTNELTATTV
jgi:EmrB/QacA subfamily drug resistance transporter